MTVTINVFMCIFFKLNGRNNRVHRANEPLNRSRSSRTFATPEELSLELQTQKAAFDYKSSVPLIELNFPIFYTKIQQISPPIRYGKNR